MYMCVTKVVCMYICVIDVLCMYILVNVLHLSSLTLVFVSYIFYLE